MIITKEWLNQCCCPNNGAYTSAQFEVLKVAGLYHLVSDKTGAKISGWKEKLIGAEINQELATKFWEYRSTFKTTTNNKIAKREGGKEQLDLFS
jgi:hypothetical protein